MDSELNAAGREQAALLGRALAGRKISNLSTNIFSSDLSRANDTAAAVFDACRLSGREGLVHKTDARLRERALGPFQGLTAADCMQKHRAAWV
eukprot:4527154-Prymnesium_polylepis.1